MILGKKDNLAISTIGLIGANLIPLFGVLFFDWSLLEIMFLYWLESGVIGLYNVPRMILAGGFENVLLVPFFMVHYSGFMFGHLIFILAIFGGDFLTGDGFVLTTDRLGPLLQTTAVAVLALLISHGVSFFVNFIGKKEYQKISAGEQMFKPYRRITVMHLTIIFSGFFALAFGAGIFPLLLLIGLKTATDLNAHIKAH